MKRTSFRTGAHMPQKDTWLYRIRLAKDPCHQMGTLHLSRQKSILSRTQSASYSFHFIFHLYKMLGCFCVYLWHIFAQELFNKVDKCKLSAFSLNMLGTFNIFSIKVPLHLVFNSRMFLRFTFFSSCIPHWGGSFIGIFRLSSWKGPWESVNTTQM